MKLVINFNISFYLVKITCSLTFSVDIGDFFSREALINRLKEEAQGLVEDGIDKSLKSLLRQLGLPQVILVKCMYDGKSPVFFMFSKQFLSYHKEGMKC